MKAVVCTEFGLPDKLSIEELADPVPGVGEILVRVQASSINFPDVLIIRGQYQFKPSLPFIPGAEAAGTVEALGAGVTGFSPGDRVYVVGRIGAFAELMTASAATAIKLDDDITFATAAAFGITHGTSYHAIVQQARIQARETILVLGAAGGVGLAAVAIAKALGARVLAAASSAERLAVAMSHGADELIDYSTGDLKTAVRGLTNGAGVDVVYDPLGGRYAEPAVRSLAWAGRYLVVGFAAGEIPRIPTNLLLLKSAALIGVFWGEWAVRNPQLYRENAVALCSFIRSGRVTPHIDRTFTLADAPIALRWILDRKATGKVLLVPSVQH